MVGVGGVTAEVTVQGEEGLEGVEEVLVEPGHNHPPSQDSLQKPCLQLGQLRLLLMPEVKVWLLVDMSKYAGTRLGRWMREEEGRTGMGTETGTGMVMGRDLRGSLSSHELGESLSLIFI